MQSRVCLRPYRQSFRSVYHSGALIVFILLTGTRLPVWGQEYKNATLKLTVRDDSGHPAAFRIQVFKNDKLLVHQWERDKVDLALPAGKYTLLIRHGFDYDAVRIDSLNLPDGVTEKAITLKKRYDVKSLGWYCGESHLHGQHGVMDKPQTFADAARLAEANGLNYVQIAQWWTPDFGWTSVDSLRQLARESSTSQVAVNWNMESPKSFMGPDDGGKSGNLHCYGHGCTLGLKDRPFDKDFWFTGPNFRIIQEIHRQNAVVMLAHPVRFWFNNGNLVSNMASEMAFDYVTGHGYDGVDILNDGEPYFFQHERVWWNLLNMGYKVSGTANSDGSIIDGHAGRFRTYTKINGDFSWDKIAQGIREGVCVASSGPMVIFNVDGNDPGFEFPADARVHQGNLQVWSGPLPDEALVTVQIVRNGEIIMAWDLRNRNIRQWSGGFEMSDTSFSWYSIRVVSTCKDPGLLNIWRQSSDVYDIAVTSPVYFIPNGFRRPVPAEATVKIRITDDNENPIPATVTVIDQGKEIGQQEIGATGISSITAPATALLAIEADGFAEVRKDLYMDTPIFNYCRSISDFFSPGPYQEIRKMLNNLNFEIKLKKK
jgi:hypothetical protein